MKLPRTVHVDVTADDIASGVVSNDHCPIAIAFRRAAFTAHQVSVDPWRIDATEPSEYAGRFRLVSYVLPQEATDFVKAFDDPCVYGPVGPISFEVTAS